MVEWIENDARGGERRTELVIFRLSGKDDLSDQNRLSSIAVQLLFLLKALSRYGV